MYTCFLIGQVDNSETALATFVFVPSSLPIAFVYGIYVFIAALAGTQNSGPDMELPRKERPE